MTKGYITLKDGTEVPADDFWIYAPWWFVKKFAEPIPTTEKRRKPRKSSRRSRVSQRDLYVKP